MLERVVLSVIILVLTVIKSVFTVWLLLGNFYLTGLLVVISMLSFSLIVAGLLVMIIKGVNGD